MPHRQIRSAAAVLGVLSIAAAASPAAADPASPTRLTIVAEGKVDRAPDLAEVSGGVVTTAPTAAAAMAENATRMNAVVAAVKKAGIADRDMQTGGINLQPQYRYQNNEPPVLTGYQATNTLSLRIRRIADTGRLLDTLVGVGANQISGPEFRVDDSAAALDEARVKAVKTARARAELYAAAAGLHVKRIAAISEAGASAPGPRPMAMMRMVADAAPAAPTPVAPGDVALSVSVTIQFELE